MRFSNENKYSLARTGQIQTDHSVIETPVFMPVGTHGVVKSISPNELYDLNTDPYEMNNLFNEPSHRDRIRQMAARIRVWQDQTGDSAPLPTI